MNREGPMGWHYPAGAANDPNAPYNQEDADECEVCGEWIEECTCEEECEKCGEFNKDCVCVNGD